MQLIVSDPGFMLGVPMNNKIEIVKAIEQFTEDIEVPTALILYSKCIQRADNLKKKASDIGCPLKFQSASLNGLILMSCILG